MPYRAPRLPQRLELLKLLLNRPPRLLALTRFRKLPAAVAGLQNWLLRARKRPGVNRLLQPQINTKTSKNRLPAMK